MQVTFGELKAFLEDHFPQGTAYGTLEELGDGWAEMKLEVDDGHLRPGGTVSGPVMMGLADVAMYAALLGKIGLVPLAVTTNFNINCRMIENCSVNSIHKQDISSNSCCM